MATKNDEKWLHNFECLKAYVDEHHHLPPKNAPLGAKFLLNWSKYQRKRIKAGTMPEEQKVMFEALEKMRSGAHTGGRKKKEEIKTEL